MNDISPLKAPFPWFGGKSRIAPLVWEAMGEPQHYIEPFAGSLACLLARPNLKHNSIETVNDLDGFVANFWRAMSKCPEDVIAAAEWPVNEVDLTARHYWLVQQTKGLTNRLLADPEWFDAKIAGWWVWGICAWIGSGWCSGKGPWKVVDGEFCSTKDSEAGIWRQLPHLGDGGQGVNRLVPTGSPSNEGMTRQRYWLSTLVERLRYVRVCCGDWSRVVKSHSVLFPGHATTPVTGILLDPPYDAKDIKSVYSHSAKGLTPAIQEWCRANGHDSRLRIVLCGYEGEYDLPGWRVVAWEAGYSYGKSAGKDSRGAKNAVRERLWLSPHCLTAKQDSFDLSDLDD